MGFSRPSLSFLVGFFCIISKVKSEANLGTLDKTAEIDKNFMQDISREFFFPEASDDVEIVFKASIEGRPGLPQWLHYKQADAKDKYAYIYGTPTSDDMDQTYTILVVGLNMKSYETVTWKIQITIENAKDQRKYRTTFNISNYDLDKFLSLENDVEEDFLAAVQAVWPGPDNHLAVTKITPAPDFAGGRNPIPGKPEGIVVEVGSNIEFSPELNASEKQAMESTADLCDPPPDLDLDQIISINSIFSDKGFTINWCYFKLSTVVLSDPVSAPVTTVNLGGEYTAPDYTLELREFTTEFIIVIVVPVIVALVLIIFLSYIMYGRREGLDKRNSETPNIQLLHHHSIRRATTQLRDMAQDRDQEHRPPPLSTLPSHSPTAGAAAPRDRTPSDTSQPRFPPRGGPDDQPTTSTPQHPSAGPPPYRMPPSFPPQEETSFINQPPDSGLGGRTSSEPSGLQPPPGDDTSPSLRRQPPPFMRGSGSLAPEQDSLDSVGSPQGQGGGSHHTIPDTVDEQYDEDAGLIQREYLA